VLFHITATPSWSNLPLSGLFVDMLRRIVAMSQGVVSETGQIKLAPQATLDGLGQLGAPLPTAQSIDSTAIATTPVSAIHPPGFYGTPDNRRALNLGAGLGDIVPIGALPQGVARATYERSEEIDFQPWLLALALTLLLADIIVSLWIRGLTPRLAQAASVGVLAAVVVVSLTSNGFAQSASDRIALEATLETRLAYVRTGIDALDQVTRAGLVGLTEVLAQRTSVEVARPLGVNIERDELAFFPLLYWAIDEKQPDLTPAARSKIDDYLRTGGTIIFDTRDQGTVTPSTTFGGSSAGGPGTQRLRQIL